MSAFDPPPKVTKQGTIIQAAPERPMVKVERGQIIGDTYRIDRFLGEGGMSTVLAATHLPSGRAVALKVLQPDAAQEEGAIPRFWREVRAMTHLQHPNVVRIFDVGSMPDGTPYMAMELLVGETLAARMRRLGPLPLPVARGLFLQACDAVAAAHAIGVVHRDIKPENMFLTRGENGDEVLKVLDFGISKTMRATVADDRQHLTKTTDVFGSPTYMSPEQLKASRDVDARADVWSLGVLLYEMLAGTAPFEGRSVAEIFGAILYKEPSPLGKTRTDIPPEIEKTVKRALEKDRDKRIRTVRELRSSVAGAEGASTEAGRPGRARLLAGAGLLMLAAAMLAFLIARWLG